MDVFKKYANEMPQQLERIASALEGIHYELREFNNQRRK